MEEITLLCHLEIITSALAVGAFLCSSNTRTRRVLSVPFVLPRPSLTFMI